MAYCRRDVRRPHVLAAGARDGQGGQVGHEGGEARHISGGAAGEAPRATVGVGGGDEDCPLLSA